MRGTVSVRLGRIACLGKQVQRGGEFVLMPEYSVRTCGANQDADPLTSNVTCVSVAVILWLLRRIRCPAVRLDDVL